MKILTCHSQYPYENSRGSLRVRNTHTTLYGGLAQADRGRRVN